MQDDLIEEKQKLVRDLNVYYGPQERKHKQIYLASAQMCCAVCLDGVWYRASIEEVRARGSLRIRLVDEGRQEIINWRQAYVLIEEFRLKREFAIRCSLADIEPLQENSYLYSPSAIKDFKQMTINPYLRMEIHGIKENENSVLLYVSKKNLDINIGAALVRNSHGISTGEATQVKDCFKMSKTRPSLSQPESSESPKFGEFIRTKSSQSVSAQQSKELDRGGVKRSSIVVTHIVDPSEFYIQLSKLTRGTNEFHSKIQETQNRKYNIQGNCLELPPREERQWHVGDHCLVYSIYESAPLISSIAHKSCEWYRGIITDIVRAVNSEPKYSVFLRDIGATIRSIARHQLFSIETQLDRVTNAVYLCQLAGVSPAGGVKSWSLSAIDLFKYSVENFEALSVSMRGKRANENSPLPVVLWGSTTETTDPLAPCITKYTNIGRILIEKGLAYPDEKKDAMEQFDQIEEIELKEGEITLTQWFRSLDDDTLLNGKYVCLFVQSMEELLFCSLNL